MGPSDAFKEIWVPFPQTSSICFPSAPPSSSHLRLHAPGLAMALVDYERVARAVKEWPTWVLRKAKVAAQYGFVPLVIAVGMLYTEPQPHLLQLIGP
ncbi:unnamed protein product [Closterium sp. NIES-54]